MSKVEAAFPNNGRALFDSEKAAVEAFNLKYSQLATERQEANQKAKDAMLKRITPEQVARDMLSVQPMDSAEEGMKLLSEGFVMSYRKEP